MMFDWPAPRIREVFDAHPDMTIPRLSRLTGRTVDDVRKVLFHADKLNPADTSGRFVFITNADRAAQTAGG